MRSLPLNFLFALTLFLASLLAVNFAVAGDYAAFGTALRGYDAVAYQTENKAVEGNSNFAVHHKGLTYLFASKANAEIFKTDPARYEPAYNGYCAMGVVFGKKLPADPEAFKVVDGKLYMNLNQKVQTKWLEDVPGHITKANESWPKIETVHPDKL